MRCVRSALALTFVISWLAVLPGCGGASPPPKVKSEVLHSVKGLVIKADGQPLAGGVISFSDRDIAFLAKGKIRSDGSFELSSFKGADTSDPVATGQLGVPEGDYLVKVLSPDGAKLSLKENSRFVKAGDNDFKIELLPEGERQK